MALKSFTDTGFANLLNSQLVSIGLLVASGEVFYEASSQN